MISIFLFTFTFSWSIIIPKVVICIKNFTLKSFLALFCSLTFCLNSSAMEENKLKTNTNNGNKNENIIYGGIDAEEVLSDGTKLIFVSGKNIESAYKKYKAEAEEIYSKRWSLETRQNVKDGACALSLIAGVSSLPFVFNKRCRRRALVVTSIIPIALGTYAHSYLRDKNIMRDYGHMSFSEFDYDGIPTPGYASNEMIMGPGRIMSALDPRDYNYNEYLKYGVVIIARPKSKWTEKNPKGFFSCVINQNNFTAKVRKNLEESIKKGL